VAQLGSGTGSSYPEAIDTRQTFRNGPAPAPDSDTRLDSEVINDLLHSMVNVQTALGAGIPGEFGSLAARLNQVLPGGGGTPGLLPFSNTTSLTIPGTQHNAGQAALLWQLYDNQIPAHAIQPGNVTMQVSPATYDVTLTFAAPTSGAMALGIQAPLYVGTFSNATTVSIPGSVHQLANADLLYQLYDNANPANAIEPGSFTVNTTTRDVLITFTIARSGTVILSSGGPAYAVNFSSTTSFTVLGSVHQLGTTAILFQAYDAATPVRAALGDPDVSVHPTTLDLTVAFTIPTSGRIVFGAASTLTGREFDLRDTGVVNQTAVRVRSQTGTLHLQAGSGDRVALDDKVGQTKMILNSATGAVGIGVTNPTHQLELSTGDAVKLGGGPWNAPSMAALKEAITPFTDGLDTVLGLEPIRYQYNGRGGIARTGEQFVGLLAEAVRPVAPYLVRPYQGQLEPGAPLTPMLALDSGPLVYLLINAVKTLHAWLLEARHAQQRLEQQVAALAAQVAALAAQLAPPSRPEEESTP